jgi:hypothetical protein
LLGCLVAAALLAVAQAPKAGPVARRADGKPDMQGNWDSPVSPAYDVEDHMVQVYGIPPGKGVIVDPPGGKIPYQPWALAKRKDLIENHPYEDPQAHCYASGVPRTVYAPFGFQILQPDGYVVMLFENFHLYRIIPTDGRPHLPADMLLWMGDSRGHWEGDTLVVDVTNQNGKSWFDMAANFSSESIHVVERWKPVDSNTIHYEAVIEDPKLYTRPWTIGLDIHRARGHHELMELACREGERDLEHYTEDAGGKKSK